MQIHAVAASGYQMGAQAYERGRPGYPSAAVHLLTEVTGLGAGQIAVDVGAGTGKWTTHLVGTGASVIAVEPVEAMRALLREAEPQAHAIAGTAEALPIATAAVHTVTVATAVHWFDLPVAVPELVRVVRPGGHVAILRNQRDTAVPWVAALDRLLEPHRAGVPVSSRIPWREAFAAHQELEPVADERLANPQQLEAAMLCTRVASTSFVAAMPEHERTQLLARVADFAARLPNPITMPYSTVVWVLRRRAEHTRRQP